MAEKRLLKGVCDFFNIADARAVIVTDVKFDDALFLWEFFLLNFKRPKEHVVNIDIFTTGIKDTAAGVCLSKHLFAEAYRCASEKKTDLCTVNLRAFASKKPAIHAPRHEKDTYAAYRDPSTNFPQAAAEEKMWQDEPVSSCKADFVGVIAQFFNFEVVDKKDEPPDEQMLDYIVPKEGGVLAFQSGFNTKVQGGIEKEKALWNALSCKVNDAKAKIVFISNGFSFDRGSGKPGVIEPSHDVIMTLKGQSPLLWGHLVEAGLRESLIFSADQMAKWLTQEQMDGVEWGNEAFKSRICKFAEEKGVPKDTRANASLHLRKKYLEARKTVATAENPILQMAKDLYAITHEVFPVASDYLGRAVSNMEKFGQMLEVTDGQHFACLLQDEAAILLPVEMREPEGPGKPWLEPSFKDVTSDLMWGARDVKVPDSKKWMKEAIMM